MIEKSSWLEVSPECRIERLPNGKAVVVMPWGSTQDFDSVYSAKKYLKRPSVIHELESFRAEKTNG